MVVTTWNWGWCISSFFSRVRPWLSVNLLYTLLNVNAVDSNTKKIKISFTCTLHIHSRLHRSWKREKISVTANSVYKVNRSGRKVWSQQRHFSTFLNVEFMDDGAQSLKECQINRLLRWSVTPKWRFLRLTLFTIGRKVNNIKILVVSWNAMKFMISDIGLMWRHKAEID